MENMMGISRPNRIAMLAEIKTSETPKKTRYSDEELKEFGSLIEGKLLIATYDYNHYRGVNINENGTEDTTPSFKVLEEGAATLSKEEIKKTTKRQELFIAQLKAAQVRIKNKTYGICRETGKLISKERLSAVPHATLSIDAKNNQK